MLASASTISVVSDQIQRHKIEKTVIDPVMVATTGAQLLPENAVRTLCDVLLPRTFILTPNIPEANLILKESGRPAVDVQDLKGLKRLASEVLKLGPKYVLIKGGHVPLTSDQQVAKSDGEKKIVVNILAGGDEVEVIQSSYQASRNTHGTGCSLACESRTSISFVRFELTITKLRYLAILPMACQSPEPSEVLAGM